MYQFRTKPRAIGPLEALSTFWIQYSNTRDRAPRSEYWWNFIFIILSYIFMTAIMNRFQSTGAMIFDGLWVLLLLIPSISLTIRRFHDINISGVIMVILCLLSSIVQVVPIAYSSYKFVSTITKQLKHPELIIGGIALSLIIMVVFMLAIYCMGGWLLFPLESLIALGYFTNNIISKIILSIQSAFYKNIGNMLTIIVPKDVHLHIPVSSFLFRTSSTSSLQWITLIVTICCGIAFFIVLLTASQESSYGQGHGTNLIL